MQNILKKYQAVFCVCRLIYNGHFVYYQKAVLGPFKVFWHAIIHCYWKIRAYY